MYILMGRYEDYPDDWDERRKRVYKRDNYQCQNCGARGGPYGDTELHAHHIQPKNKGGSHRLRNLEALCQRCHDAAHDHDIPKMSELSRLSRSTSTKSTNIGHSAEQMDSKTERLRDIYMNVSDESFQADNSDSVNHSESESGVFEKLLSAVKFWS